MTGWFSALEPVEVPIECGGQTHRLRWADGALGTPDHADPDGERALAALGGEPSRCVQVLDAWLRHADDLDVLVLAGRGPSDPLALATATGSLGAFVSSPRGARGMARPIPQGPRPGAARGWFVYAPLSGAPTSGPRGTHPGEPLDEVETLLGLGAGLSERLVAGVVATWVERLAAGDERSAAARPTLQAALYGRALVALRAWLGGQDLDVEVILTAADGARSLVREGGRLRLSLPLNWLTEVWAPGLSVVLGRFCLAAEPVERGWRLHVIDQSLGPPRTMTLALD